MAILTSVGESYGLMAVFQAYPQGLEPWLKLHQAVMLEAIAACVSGLNACQCGHESHKAVAAHLGFPAAVSDPLQQDRESAEIEAALRPLGLLTPTLMCSLSYLSDALGFPCFDEP